MAGIIGIHPGPFTLRELIMMAEGKLARQWDHTSQVLAMLVNVNRDPKKSKPVLPDTFHPFKFSKAKKKKNAPLTDIKDLMVFLPPSEKEKVKSNE